MKATNVVEQFKWERDIALEQLKELGYRLGQKVDPKEVELLKAYRTCPYDVLLRSDYIATTLWSRHDIALRLEELGYQGTEKEVDAVLETGYLKNLGDCTDGDWQMIDDAINEAALRSEDMCSREDNEDE